MEERIGVITGSAYFFSSLEIALFPIDKYAAFF
jgi:hypothetical protein